MDCLNLLLWKANFRLWVVLTQNQLTSCVVPPFVLFYKPADATILLDLYDNEVISLRTAPVVDGYALA